MESGSQRSEQWQFPQRSFLLSVGIRPYTLSSNIVITESSGNAFASIGVTRRIDMLGDGLVDIVDVAFAASLFGSTINSPGYNGLADVDASGAVNIVDISNIAFYFDAIDFM